MILASVISFSCGSQDVINTNPLRKLTHIKCELWSDIQGIIYLWSLQRKSLWKLLLIAATLQAQWAITPCCTDLLLPSGQMERQIAGKRGTTSGYVGLHVLWGVVDSEARWKHQLDLSWAAQLSAEGNLTELITRRHLHSSPTLISHFHFLSLSLSLLHISISLNLPSRLQFLKLSRCNVRELFTCLLQSWGRLGKDCHVGNRLFRLPQHTAFICQVQYYLWCFDFSLCRVLANIDIDIPDCASASPWAKHNMNCNEL